MSNDLETISNLKVLDEVKAVVSTLDQLLRELFGQACWQWEMTSVSHRGPNARVKLYIPHNYILATAARLAEHSESWQYLYPLEFEIATSSAKVTITLREFPGGGQ